MFPCVKATGGKKAWKVETAARGSSQRSLFEQAQDQLDAEKLRSIRKQKKLNVVALMMMPIPTRAQNGAGE